MQSLNVAYDAFVLQVNYASVTADAVTPSSGSGLTQTFLLQYSDSAGAASLATVWAVFSGSANNPAANTCAVYYNRSSNTLYLENDAANAASGAVLGTNTTLQNSQCSVSVAGTSVSLSGNVLSLNLAVTFASAYSGTKSIYLGGGRTAGSEHRVAVVWKLGNSGRGANNHGRFGDAQLRLGADADVRAAVLGPRGRGNAWRCVVGV